jgi:anti-sigma B factor antagonist
MTNAVTEDSGKLVVALTGDIDLEHAPGVRELLLDCVGRAKDVVVDFTAVDYIDSSGVANLVEALQTANKQNTGFALVSVTGQAMRVLQLARLEKVFTIHDDLAAANMATGMATGRAAG